ncbi:MAG: NgoFVII family restriction endonuclease [Chloroflexota bacterium]|nr:MAG: NgoFVII family restriction endonuclease [Chloroflexota bacterium]
MPRIFDNIEQHLLPALKETIQLAHRADFCVGYFNLRGWKALGSLVDEWDGGDGKCVRLLVGMQQAPQDELRAALSLKEQDEGIDNARVIQLKRKLAQEFREQLTFGVPTNQDEAALRQLAAQLRSKKVIVKLFLDHPLHAKLYLFFRNDPNNPITGFLGSSNLTFAGLLKQGELNIDVLDHDAAKKLAKWFNDRWGDRWCVDITDELAAIIESSWAREEMIPPYHIYINIAYHLSQEARAGLAEFRIPNDLKGALTEFQSAAVKIAAHHVNKREGVLLGDVVGFGKTRMATTLARIFDDDYGYDTLILCPKNLVKMWEDYRDKYRFHGKVLSLSRAQNELPDLRRYRLVIIDESHNLRNREGKRYKQIQEYISKNDSKCILLSATPYNKEYVDLSNQLRLFVPEDKDLGIRPERLLNEIGEIEFNLRYQAGPRTLAAFEKSEYADDWRELMRLFLVRRTRSFILDNYAQTDERGRKYLELENGARSYFPTRKPITVKFKIDDTNPDDQYARLYSDQVVSVINALHLPRYGLGNYADPPKVKPTAQEDAVLADLSRAGKRLMGFTRTNLFKRLESSGAVFLQSLERHILRNHIFLYAIENNKPLPIGQQDAAMLDAQNYDADIDATKTAVNLFDDDEENDESPRVETFDKSSEVSKTSEVLFRQRAEQLYRELETEYKRRFKWIRPALFDKRLAINLLADAQALTQILVQAGAWNPAADTKLDALYKLLTKKHPNDKVLLFTQFADTVDYLTAQLQARGVPQLEGVTGQSADPTALAWRFSPVSNDKRDKIESADELRVLIATDVLSEGQNLQDANIVVNYDLPWAIIRLIQRAGRVDRLGQQAQTILCYSFLPAEGVEKIIRLRSRVRQRLQQNAEVIGTDEMFFEDEQEKQTVLNLYNEKSGIFDGDDDTEVDLASYAYQIWQNAIKENPELKKTIPELPRVAYSARAATDFRSLQNFGSLNSGSLNPGVLVYLRTAEGNDALAWVDEQGNPITESQFVILNAAKCEPDTPAVPRADNHFKLVEQGVKTILAEEKTVGGQLGRPSSARAKTYNRLMRYAEEMRGTLFDTPELRRALDDLYKFPLRESARDTLNRQLRAGIDDQQLVELVIALRDEGRLCIADETEAQAMQEPLIICSLGLV